MSRERVFTDMAGMSTMREMAVSSQFMMTGTTSTLLLPSSRSQEETTEAAGLSELKAHYAKMRQRTLN